MKHGGFRMVTIQKAGWGWADEKTSDSYGNRRLLLQRVVSMLFVHFVHPFFAFLLKAFLFFLQGFEFRHQTRWLT